MFECCKIFREDKEYVKNEPHDRQPQTPITELNTILIGNGCVAKQKSLLKRVSGCFQRTLEKKCVDSEGEYVEDWNLQASVTP
ncbi:hypothetical protein AVEN_56193-1 [Araneus ventricosus]|uniref:Uncharacterized protein n=1 Tax=Araneus ventricosus TaxID=182803 RepID=A0A4Y2UC65_ARAVE|nr:hypothetical protein AVEN_56193-1 [Araneus ventricosus]